MFKYFIVNTIFNALNNCRDIYLIILINTAVLIFFQIIEQSKNASKQEIREILDHIKEFESKFGSLYDLRDVVQEFLKKKY